MSVKNKKKKYGTVQSTAKHIKKQVREVAVKRPTQSEDVVV